MKTRQKRRGAWKTAIVPHENHDQDGAVSSLLVFVLSTRTFELSLTSCVSQIECSIIQTGFSVLFLALLVLAQNQNGPPLRVRECTALFASFQQWEFATDGTEEIVLLSNGLCIDVSRPSSSFMHAGLSLRWWMNECFYLSSGVFVCNC
jgi:hypothetical protein